MFYYNLGLKKLMSTLRKYGTVQNAQKQCNDGFGSTSANGVNFSGLKGWNKIPEGKNIAKEIEIGMNQQIQHILEHWQVRMAS